jgi:twinfilin-like protein
MHISDSNFISFVTVDMASKTLGNKPSITVKRAFSDWPTEILVETHDAFNAFSQDASLFALRLQIQSDRLVAFTAVQFPGGDPSDFRKALSKLGSDIDNKIPTYLILRWRGSLAAITYVPYLADAALQDAYLQHRHELVTNLGAANFSLAIICKEPGEVIDARAWEERDGEASSLNEDAKNSCETCSKTEESSSTMKDLGFKKNKCRLCDQRMKNDINADAEGALSTLSDGGACVQLVRPSTIWSYHGG